MCVNQMDLIFRVCCPIVKGLRYTFLERGTCLSGKGVYTLKKIATRYKLKDDIINEKKGHTNGR